MKAHLAQKTLFFLFIYLLSNASILAQENWLLNPRFEVIEPFSEGLAIVKEKAGSVWQRGIEGVIDTNGELLWTLPQNLSFVNNNYETLIFSEGLITVKDLNTENELYGYVDTKGKLVIPCQFENAGDFHEGLAWFQDSDFKIGFINNKGKKIIEAQYDDTGDFSQGLCAVSKLIDKDNYISKWGYINKEGQVVIPFRESYYGSSFQENGLAFFTFIGKATDGFSIDGSTQIINQKGNVINPFLSYLAYDFNEDGLLAVTKKVPYEWEDGYTGYISKVGFANEKGELIIDYQFDTYGPMDVPPVFSEGLCIVGQIQNQENGGMMYGFINTEGELIVDFQYDVARPFQNGLAQVTSYDKDYQENNYFIDTEGNKVIAFPSEYGVSYYFHGFENGYCIVEKYADNNSCNIMDKQGNFIYDRWFEEISFLGENLVAFKIKGLWGVKELNF